MSNGACDFPTLLNLDNPGGADEAFYNNDTGEEEASSVVLLKMLSVKSSAKGKI